MSVPESSADDGELSEQDKATLLEGRRQTAELQRLGRERRAASGQLGAGYDPSLDPNAI